MAIALGSTLGSVTRASGVNAVLTFAFNNVAGDFLVVDLLTDATATTDFLSSVTYNGVTMTRIFDTGAAAYTGEKYHAYSYYLIAPATGSHNVVATTSFDNAADSINAVAVSYTGAKQSAQPDSFAVRSADSYSSPQTITTTVVASGCWLHGCIYCPTPAVSTGTTSRASSTSSNTLNAADSNGTVGTGSQSLVWTYASGGYNIGVFSIAPVPAAGPANIKTINGITLANVKTVNGIAIASVKSINGIS